MAEDKATENGKYFNVSTLWSAKGEDKNHTLSIGAYAGRMSFTIFSGTGNGKPISISIPMEAHVLITGILAELKKGIPGAAHPFRIKAWDANNNKRELKQVLTFGIDENGCYYIDFKDVVTVMAARFPIIGNRNYETGVEADSNSTRSRIGFAAFCVFFNQLPTACLLTKNRPPVNYTNGRSNYTNTNTSYNRGASSAPASMPTSVPSEDGDIY